MTPILVALDIEGDGQRVPGPIEIGIADVLDGRVINVEEWRVRSERGITRWATRVHGLRDDDVANCPRFDEIAAALRPRIAGAIIVGHAVHNDLHVMRRVLPGLRIAGMIDTLKMARKLIPNLPSYGLHAMAHAIGLPEPEGDFRGRHSGGYDAVLAADLFLHMLPMPGAERHLRDTLGGMSRDLFTQESPAP